MGCIFLVFYFWVNSLTNYWRCRLFCNFLLNPLFIQPKIACKKKLDFSLKVLVNNIYIWVQLRTVTFLCFKKKGYAYIASFFVIWLQKQKVSWTVCDGKFSRNKLLRFWKHFFVWHEFLGYWYLKIQKFIYLVLLVWTLKQPRNITSS